MTREQRPRDGTKSNQLETYAETREKSAVTQPSRTGSARCPQSLHGVGAHSCPAAWLAPGCQLPRSVWGWAGRGGGAQAGGIWAVGGRRCWAGIWSRRETSGEAGARRKPALRDKSRRRAPRRRQARLQEGSRDCAALRQGQAQVFTLAGSGASETNSRFLGRTRPCSKERSFSAESELS